MTAAPAKPGPKPRDPAENRSKAINCRFPPDFVAWFGRYAEHRKVDKTELLGRCIEFFAAAKEDFEPPPPR